ncbi:MAG: aspartyl protease family protein [Janthinobacterium lividum]
MKYNLLLRPIACALLLSIFSFGLPSVQASPPAVKLTLSQLLQRHRNAAATPAAQKDKTAHEIVYDISAGGLMGSMTTYEAPVHRNRMEMKLGPIATTTGSDGKVTWEQDGAGNVRILGGEEMAERVADTGFSLEEFDPIKNKAQAVVTLRPTLDPVTGCYVVDVKPKNGSQQTMYIDPKTFLIKKSVESKGGLTGTITVLAYSLQDGTEVPSHTAIQYAGLPLIIDATLKSVTRLPSVEASLFAPPTPAKDWKFLASGPVVSASLPFETADNEIVLPVTINGHTLRLLLDSGSGTSFVTEAAAQTAGLTTQGNLPALGYGGTAATGITTDTTLDVGDAVRLSHQTLHVIQDPAITRQLTERGNLDGAIGYELFARLRIGIDYRNKTLILTDPAAAFPAPSAGTAVVPIKLENRVPTVMASVDGKAAGRFLIDTGDSGAAHIYTQYAEANQLMPQANALGTTTRQGVGVGGQITETISPGHTLRVSTVGVSGLPLSTMTGAGIAQISTQAGGIGNLFLNHFAVTFDYSQGKLFLTPVPAPVVFRSTEPRLILAADDTTAPGMTLETLLQRHLTALGGAAALTAIQNTKITSTVLTGGIKGTITTIYAAPNKEFEEDKLGILDNLQGYDGSVAWERDTNGNVRALAGEELKDLRVQLFFDTNSYVLPGRIPGKETLRPETETGTGDYIIDTLPEGGKESTIFIDPSTYMIVKEQHLDDDVLVITTYSDYRLVDSTPFPYHTVTTNGTARYDIVGDVTKIENNAAVPPGIFSEPVGGKNFGFIKPGITQATVPFDMDDGEIGLEVRLNGTPERVFLDSGAGGIALAQSAATALGLKSSGFLEVRGYGGSTDQHPILIDKLEVPSAVQLTNVAAIAIALPEQLDAYFTRPLAGFVGYDLLSHFVVRIDYPHKKITFIQADAFYPTHADGTSLPLNLDSNLPTIQAHLDALPDRQFLIDTGDADAAVRLYGPYVVANGLNKKYPHGAIAIGGGIGGVSRARRTRIDSFTIAGTTFHNIPTDFSLDTKGGASLVNAGSLGSHLLSRFVVTFDYPHNRVFFAPVPGTRTAFVTRTTGISLMETKDKQGHAHLAVADILPGAPALKAGLSTFDEVLQVDGKPAGQLGLTRARNMLMTTVGPHHWLLVQSTIGKPRTVAVGLFDPLD